ncbi:MAG: hypothetical protein HY827_03080 [Actinobacteria bacterium]|nr:hypothetical protein [Actinomycetota bacterium]
MARVLIVERAGREERVAEVLRGRDYAVRTVEADPLLPGHVFELLDGVAVVCWLMGAGEGLNPEANGEQLETVLLKVVDTGVRGFVFEREDDAPNEHVEHARATWHIPIEEVPAGGSDIAGADAGASADRTDPAAAWAEAVADAVDATLGVTR